MKKTLLLVFIHGFKGTDHTFNNFPKELRAALSSHLPKIDVRAITYPQYDTRGDLKDCVASFKEWLQNKVIDLEVAAKTPSPTVDPSVHVILCGHSMGGIVAAETLLSIARDEPVPSSYGNNTTNSTTEYDSGKSRPANLNLSESESPKEKSTLFFPYIHAVLAFDTPYLGISPGVLAHGAEEQASSVYNAWNTANKVFGWDSSNSTPPPPAAEAAGKGLPAANSSGSKWGRYAMMGGAAAAIAGVAGAAYLNWNQINQGLAWAGSHLEFVGCLARGAELQKRVEKVVELTRTHDVGFANFYGALDEKITSKTKYAGAFVGQDRTFCVIPKQARRGDSPTGTKRGPPPAEAGASRPKKRRSKGEADMQAEMEQGEQVHQFVEDTTKSKGRWVKNINPSATDEVAAHTTMFSPEKNPDFHAMLKRARDQIADWIHGPWYESSGDEPEPELEAREGSATAGDPADDLMEEETASPPA